MGNLVKNMRAILHKLQSGPDATVEIASLISAYNNRSAYRVRNCRPRTDLMVNGLLTKPSWGRGLIAEAGLATMKARELKNPSDLAMHSTRYIDIAFYLGTWDRGEKFCQLAIEVENAWHELRGTLADLFAFQAREKWGVFYSPAGVSPSVPLSEAIADVRDHFAAAGLCESPDTAYEIVAFPDAIGERGLLGEKVTEFSFKSGAHSVGHPTEVVL